MSNWTIKGTYQVAEGVHRIPLPLPTDGLRSVNVYAIASGDRFTLVDGGWAIDEARQDLEDGLAAIGGSLEAIDTFLVTHIHRDHFTQAISVRKEFGTPVALGEGERPALDDLRRPGKLALDSQLRRLSVVGAKSLVDELAQLGMNSSIDQSEWEYPDVWLTGGVEIHLADRTLLAIHTPGHTRGHVVFADLTNGLLFAGDHVLPHITPSIGFENVPTEQPLGDFLRSLAAMASLPDLELLPAHGPIAPSVHSRVKELVDHHERRLESCLQAVESGAATAYEVACRIKWTHRHTAFVDLDAFNRMLATLETVAHLDLLAFRGALTKTSVDGMEEYV